MNIILRTVLSLLLFNVIKLDSLSFHLKTIVLRLETREWMSWWKEGGGWWWWWEEGKKKRNLSNLKLLYRCLHDQVHLVFFFFLPGFLSHLKNNQVSLLSFSFESGGVSGNGWEVGQSFWGWILLRRRKTVQENGKNPGRRGTGRRTVRTQRYFYFSLLILQLGILKTGRFIICTFICPDRPELGLRMPEGLSIWETGSWWIQIIEDLCPVRCSFALPTGFPNGIDSYIGNVCFIDVTKCTNLQA